MSTYAIVSTGGKQYRVSPGQRFQVEKLDAQEGETVEFKDVRLVSRDGAVTVGAPNVEGARVLAEVESQGKGDKIVVFKYKAKTRYRRKQGHRQPYTTLKVTDINPGG